LPLAGGNSARFEWYDSPEYQDALKIGHKYATFRRYAVEGQ
jgi:hypothetical protein